MTSTIKLSELIAVWNILHVKDVGEIGFCDVDNALRAAGVKVINDVDCNQPKEPHDD